MFFKSNKEIETKDIALGDYDQIWTKFCFMDETGDLTSAKDPYFTIGLIKMSQPYYLQSKILYERNKRNFHDEMKFNKASKNNIEFFKFAIGAFLDTRSMGVSSFKNGFKNRYFNLFVEHSSNVGK